MLRRIALAGICLALAILLAGATSVRANAQGSSAKMHSRAELGIWGSDKVSFYREVMRDIANLPSTPAQNNPATGAAITADEVGAGMSTAEIAAGTLPATLSVGTIFLGSAAFYTGWKIGGAGVALYRDIFGDPADVAAANGQSLAWKSACANADGSCTTASLSTGPFCSGGTYIGDAGAGTNTCTGVLKGYYLAGPVATVFYCQPASAANCTVSTAISNAAHAVPGVEVFSTGLGTAGTCGTNVPIGQCVLKLKNYTDMKVRAKVGTITSFNSATGTKDMSAWKIPSTTSDTDVENGLNAVHFFDSSVSSADNEAAKCAMAVRVDPSYVCASTGVSAAVPGSSIVGSPSFLLPAPDVFESYKTYVQRLRDLGYLGEVDTADDTMPYAANSYALGLNPESITGVKVGVGSYTNTFNQTTGVRTSWPVNAPSVTPGTTTLITIRKVPDGYSPSGPYAGAGAPIAGGTCQCGSVTLTPLTTLDYGSKFPFGVFSWLNSFGGGFGSDPQPVTFDLGLFGGTQTITLSSSAWEDTYRPIVFGILEFLETLAAVWFLAFRVIGFGGD